jgi:hypothetical protein
MSRLTFALPKSRIRYDKQLAIDFSCQQHSSLLYRINNNNNNKINTDQHEQCLHQTSMMQRSNLLQHIYKYNDRSTTFSIISTTKKTNILRARSIHNIFNLSILTIDTIPRRCTNQIINQTYRQQILGLVLRHQQKYIPAIERKKIVYSYSKKREN